MYYDMAAFMLVRARHHDPRAVIEINARWMYFIMNGRMPDCTY